MSKSLFVNSYWINRRTAFAFGLLTILTVAGSVLNHRTLSRGISSMTPGLAANAGARSANLAPMNPCSASPVVTINADSGLGSLRAAVLDACPDATITFDMSQVVSPIILTSGELLIDKNLTIQGPTTAPLTISGNLNSRIFNVNPGITALISSLTISNGRAAFGGGIYNQGTLTIIASAINANASANGVDGSAASNGTNGGDGGGLYNSGTLTVINSTISGNVAGNGGNATGTGLGGNGGNGGGIYNGGTLLLINDTIAQNRAGQNGFNTTGDETNVDLGTPGHGGGLYTATTTAILRNTIIATNLTTFKSHMLVLVLNNPVLLTSTQDNNNDGGGTVDSSSSFNLIGAIDGLSGITPGDNGNQAGSADTPLNPLLGSLTDNGGPTATHLPQEFSPAIDAGSNALATDQNNVALATDQRGTTFPRILNGTVDIGSVETVAPPPPPSADLSITKTGPSQVHPDSNVTYTITVTNAGPDTAINPEFSDTLPDSEPSGFQMTFVSFNKTSGPAWDNCNVTSSGELCKTSSLPAGSTSTFTLVGYVPAGVPDGGQYTNQTTVAFPVNNNTSDPYDENNIASTVLTVASCFSDQVVTTNVNTGAGSLRQAILDACPNSTISFDMTQVVSPISLAGELIVDKNLTIQGPGASLLTVSGNQASRVFNIGSGVTAVISGLTVANGKVNGLGGGIYIDVDGVLTLTEITLSGNSVASASGSSNGGGIYNLGTVTLSNSTLSGNSISCSLGCDSQGGAIWSNGTLTVINSTLSGNTATGDAATRTYAGAIYNEGTLTLTNSTLSGNSVSGGFENRGGGIYNPGSVTITNSTLSGNTASDGINEGGGIHNSNELNVRNTIIANNTADAGLDVFGPLTSQGHNLIFSQIGATITGDTTGNLPAGTNPQLGPLQNNGGPTQTMALLLGSPLLDAGNNCVFDNNCTPALAAAITTDQRGFGRKVDGPDADTTDTVDIGAFEAQVSVEDIFDKATNEDTQLQFIFNIGGNVSTVTATSSNPGVVPDPSLSGSGSTRTLTINPAANQFGTSTITVTVADNNGQSMTDTFVLMVNPVGDLPSVTNAATTVNTQTISGLVITKNPVDGAEVTHFKITNINNGTLFKNDGTTQINTGDFITEAEGNAGLKFTPALNSTSVGSFGVQGATGDTGTGLSVAGATATITVNCGQTIVTNSNNNGAGSLRSIINAACVGATITFDMTPGNVTSPIALTTSELLINKNLTITGPGANLLTISGQGARRIFNITSGQTVSVTGLTLSNGRVGIAGGINQGGAIYNAGNLTLTNATVSNSFVQSGNSNQGGGIANLGTLTITNSTIQGNNALNASGSGANNKGGGIYNEGTLTVTSSEIANNFARGNNSVNEGGGIYSAGNATILSSTLVGNIVLGINGSSTGFGGGVRSVSNKLIIVNSTIAHNQVVGNNSNFGGGIENSSSSTLVLVSSTVASNSVGGGSSVAGGVRTIGPANVRNTIIANNSAPTSPDVDGTFNSQGHNLIRNTSGSNGFGSNGDITGVDPLLSSLSDHGGPTQTMGLQLGSPAFDAGDNCVLDVAHCSDPDTPQLTFDQRGTPFARSVDGPDVDTTAAVDIGAFEAQVSIEDIPDKTINEDAQLQFTFNIGGGANVTNVTAVSLNSTLVPNDPANIALSGSGSTRTLTIIPVANRFGTATIGVNVIGANSQTLGDSFVLTVNPVPDTPAVTNASTTVNAQTTSGLVISRSPADAAEVTHFKITNITGGTLFKNDGTTQITNDTFITFAEGNAGLKFTPPLNSTANGGFQVQASLSNNNGGLAGGLATATISVNCGATVVVNSNDNGAGSLRDTILHACDGATITFDLTPGKVTNPITLTSGELLMNKSLVIQGPGANILTLQRSAAAGTPLFSIFNNPSGLSLGVSGLTLSNADNPNNGGAIKNAGTLSLNSMALSNNHTAAAGSALFNAETGNATIANSTFSNNNSDQFATIYNQGGALNLTNSTLAANANLSNFPGAAIFSESFAGVTNITNCTIAQNTGQTEVVWRNGNNGALINLKNTIVSGNAGGNVNGTTDLGNNLIGGNALLAPLGNYGGPTQTVALLPGSPAINAGTSTGTPATDQRGISRVGAVDIGAFESRGFTITATSGTPQSASITLTFAAPLLATVTGVGGEPVADGAITFTAPASGPSASFSGGVTVFNTVINASGQAGTPAIANAIAGGPYNVTATGVGATPASFSLTNDKAAPSTVVSSSVNPSDLGQSVTFTATVTSGAGTPTGSVQFKDNGANLGGPIALNASGRAQFTTSALTAATHTITADYSGDANFLLSTGTLTGGQVVRPQPSLSINDVAIAEGNAGTKVLTFTVTLSAASSLMVTADFSTANGTATAGSDYVITNGTSKFIPGETTKTIPVTINGDVGFEPDETFVVNLSNPVNATISDNQGTGTIQNDDVLGGFISFSQVNSNVNESTGIVTLTVVRTNDVSQTVNVDYATDDTGASTNCAALNTGLASQRCDFTAVFGTLQFAANETQKTVDIPINLDSYIEGPESFSVKLSNPTGGAALAVPSTGVVTINDSTSPAPNAIDDTTTFVRQQYRDFLNREADAAGLAFWKNNIDKCNDPAQRPPGQTLAACIEVQRIVTSAAFFLSLEFKGTGGLVRDFYVAALDRPLTNNMPNFVEFMRDTQAIQKGVVVGQGNWQQVLDANRTAFMNDFVTRTEFVALYPTTDTPTQYVDKLYLHANVTGTPQERLDAIADFGGAPTAADTGARGRALLRVTQAGAFQARELNRGFVQMQYFGYLRRNPNDPPDGNFNGFNFWVNKLNQFNGDFLQAEMVKAFLSSLEYRGRFGP